MEFGFVCFLLQEPTQRIWKDKKEIETEEDDDDDDEEEEEEFTEVVGGVPCCRKPAPAPNTQLHNDLKVEYNKLCSILVISWSSHWWSLHWKWRVF